MMAYVKDGSVTSVDDYVCEEGWDFDDFLKLVMYLAIIAGAAIFLF